MHPLKQIIALLPCLLALSLTPAAAQTLAQAQALFKEGRYAEAKPVFEKYLQRAPSNGNYNLWYGACCLRTGEAEKAVRPLETAVRRHVPSGQLWLGQAYDATYRYEDAISTFEDYIADLRRRRRSTQEADSLMALFRTHLRMLRGVERVCVVDSFVVDKAGFLGAYLLSPQTGHLYPYAEYFDGTSRQGTSVYVNELGNKIFYSEATDAGVQQLRTSVLLGDGWSAGTPLTGYFPETSDTAYPYLLGDGITLYYASRGDGSLGGYDIFVTRYDTNTDAYLRPDNIGMPFNSPANDYMYVVDEYANLGWFASDRHQPEGRVCIYVFIPNATKEVYDYEQTDPARLRSLAALNALRDTWSDPDAVVQAQARLAEVEQAGDAVNQPQPDFTFVVDDQRTYHAEQDFRSPQALALYRQYTQSRQALHQQRTRLDGLRDTYAQASPDERTRLAPAILDLEKHLRKLELEARQLEKEVRKAEAAQH